MYLKMMWTSLAKQCAEHKLSWTKQQMPIHSFLDILPVMCVCGGGEVTLHVSDSAAENRTVTSGLVQETDPCKSVAHFLDAV